MIVHSGASAFIPTCVVVAVAALLAGCAPDDTDTALRPTGYWGNTQILAERSTGCLYVVNVKSRDLDQPKAMLRPDGSHMGCRPASPHAETGG